MQCSQTAPGAKLHLFHQFQDAMTIPTLNMSTKNILPSSVSLYSPVPKLCTRAERRHSFSPPNGLFGSMSLHRTHRGSERRQLCLLILIHTRPVSLCVSKHVKTCSKEYLGLNLKYGCGMSFRCPSWRTATWRGSQSRPLRPDFQDIPPLTVNTMTPNPYENWVTRRH